MENDIVSITSGGYFYLSSICVSKVNKSTLKCTQKIGLLKLRQCN